MDSIAKEKLRNHFQELISLSDEEFEYAASFYHQKHFKKHQFVVQEDQLEVPEYFVVSGLVKAYSTNFEGKDHILQFAMEDWWVTDYNAFYNGGKATINIDCIEECDLLYISLEDKDHICSEIHKLEHFFRVKSNKGYVALQKRILTLLNKDASGRYDEFIRLYPSLVQRIPKTILASYLGVSRETLSRLGK
ncbi:Crp/Fnr family transcriptional regulator [Marinigracilibium pacificum]|uniref:Crp/Fnr family transcriptional regulator n=1 Tax=Marinigracilibium pacificum TaxID=2729599 RepID=A0A848J1E0_9BACT|nr:Crp/Fnr family transcriptional regulator [Marinigracilibium pacificum]NMM48294.1 Crp/Fnr family transcriptional regulator [Marinigracilibium pacificum]